MTGFTPYFIGPVNVGLQRDLDSYLIPEDAFPILDNAYVWRGRVYKKGGYQLLGQGPKAGRLGTRTIQIGTRSAGADIYNLTISTSANDRPVEPGSLIITDGVTTFTDNGLGGFVVTPAPGNGTVNAPTNYTTSAINITFNIGNNGALVTANYIVKVNNNSPCMGLRTFELSNSIFGGLVAFDLTSAYQFNNATFQFDNTRFYKTTTNVVSWTGSNTDFFDSTNYQGAMFATNNIPGANFYVITAVTQAANAQITIGANNLRVGDWVVIGNITDNPNQGTLNGLMGQVTVIGNPITTNINTAAANAYASGGVLWELTNTKTAAGDGIRWYDGFTAGNNPATGWVNFEPALQSGPNNSTGTETPPILQGALLLFIYKNRMVALNTIEGVTAGGAQRFPQRARWSSENNIFTTPDLLPVNYDGPSTIDVDAWAQDIVGKGGFSDAPTAEQIISAEFIKDTLVVYFENSTYKLTFTGNAEIPFIWEKINTEIGSESTFSIVPFDRQILSVGANGIYACDSISIERIDRIIPDEVFTFHTTTNNSKRIQGIRDFYAETVQWCFTDDDDPQFTNFPYKTLLFNYVNNTFSIFYNSFTCFGHFSTFNDLTWINAVDFWANYNRSWDSFISQSGLPIVVAGNQQGFVFNLQNSDGSKIAYNDTSLVLQAVTAGPPSVFTVPNHNLSPYIPTPSGPSGDFINFVGASLPGALIGPTFVIANDANYTQNTFSILDENGNYVSTGAYTFGGQIQVQDNFNITTKNLNPFFNQGKSMRLGYADFFLDTSQVEDPTTTANITVTLFQNDDPNTPVEQYNLSNLNPYITFNEKAWFRVYFESQGQFLKIQLRMSDNVADVPQPDTPAGQMFSFDNTSFPHILHGMILWMKPTGRDIYVS